MPASIIITICFAILTYVGSTISLNPQIAEAKEYLLQEVIIEEKEDYTEKEIFNFIEDVEEVYSAPVNDYFEELTKYVSKGEGSFQYEAFCDSYYTEEEKIAKGITHKGMIRKSDWDCTYWSIGYGTPGKIWIKNGKIVKEVITYDEGVKRRNEDIKYRDSLIISTCLTDSQRMVVVDFMYQHGNSSSRMRYNANKCNIEGIFWTIANWRDLYKSKKKWGMVKREQMRLNKFYN